MSSSDRTSLGDRMKTYEAPSTFRIAFKGQPIVARLDGKSFHTFTRGLKRPFDARLSDLMRETMIALIDRFGAVVGYTQSDEITLIWYVPSDGKSDYPFKGRLQKFDSVLASFAAAFFNKKLAKYLPEKEDELPCFDCRSFVVPNLTEAYNSLVWRQQDATKNAISMAAQSMFSHSQLQHKSGPEMQEMMFAKHGINFNDYPAFFKRGVFARRTKSIRPLDPEQLAKIPEHMRAEKAALMVERSSVEPVDIWLSKQVDPVRVIFHGDPVTAVPEKSIAQEELGELEGV